MDHYVDEFSLREDQELQLEFAVFNYGLKHTVVERLLKHIERDINFGKVLDLVAMAV